MGICMLGTYTSVQITDAARKTLTDVLAWKASKLGLDPLGKAIMPPRRLPSTTFPATATGAPPSARERNCTASCLKSELR
ncbi:MAG: hypothetical protein IPN20_03325 [Haliscomenobacter sp.]|nr:hypothetical protein [Haliscomenobacter sp.]